MILGSEILFKSMESLHRFCMGGLDGISPHAWQEYLRVRRVSGKSGSLRRNQFGYRLDLLQRELGIKLPNARGHLHVAVICLGSRQS